MTPLTDDEMRDLERGCGLATAEPWRHSCSAVFPAAESYSLGAFKSENDAAFIATARNLVPRMLEELQGFRDKKEEEEAEGDVEAKEAKETEEDLETAARLLSQVDDWIEGRSADPLDYSGIKEFVEEHG